MTTSQPGYSEFEFDLPEALLKDLVRLFDEMTSVPLDQNFVRNSIPEAQGVYQLYLDDELVYIGKTDSEAGLKSRLMRHANKVKQRLNLDPDKITFKAVRIFVFTAVDLEQSLIRYYSTKNSKKVAAWNNSGFGANDPGRKRDTTVFKDDHFDVMYPIDIDVPASILNLSELKTVAAVLAALKQTLPYTVRFETLGGGSKKPHRELASTPLTIPNSAHTARTILQYVQQALGPPWQVTVLPGYVIIYKEAHKYARTTAL